MCHLPVTCKMDKIKYTHMCPHTHANASTHTRVYTHTYTHAHSLMHTHVHTHTHAHPLTHAHMYTHTYTHTHAYVHTYTQTGSFRTQLTQNMICGNYCHKVVYTATHYNTCELLSHMYNSSTVLFAGII